MKKKEISNIEKKGIQASPLDKQKVTKWLESDRMFLTYRYKKQDIRYNPKSGKMSVFQPYIKKEDASTHRYALTFIQWQEIVITYWTIVIEHLVKGILYKFPRELGYLEMCKVRSKNASRRGQKLFRNLHTMGYRPKIVWWKNRANLPTKYWYIFNISRKKQWRWVSEFFMKNPSAIFKLQDLASTSSKNRIRNILSSLNLH